MSIGKNQKKIECDVTIVGLGPTGATLAGLLGSFGLAVTVIDKLDELYPHPRAAGIDHEALRILQRLGLGEAMKTHVEPYRTSEYHGQSGSVIKRISPASPPYPLGWFPNNVFDQPYMERLLRARLREHENVEVLLNTEVLGVTDTREGTTVSAVDTVDGQSISIASRYTVACDGGSSHIRRNLGIELEDHGFHEPWLVVDAEVSKEAAARLPSTQVQYCEPERPTTFVVLVGRLRRWEIRLDEGELPTGVALSDEQIWPYLKRWITPEDATIRRSAAYTFHGLTAVEWKRSHIILAGDAVHMTPPFMAQGMVQGMRDADNLAWKLSEVIKQDASQQLLESYEEERRPHVLETTTRAIELGTIIGERNSEAATLRDDQLHIESVGGTLTTVRQDLIPTLKSGFLEGSSPGAGSLLPQPFVHDGEGQALLDDVVDQGFTVVATVPPSAEVSAAVEALDAQIIVIGTERNPLETIADRIIAVSETEGVMTRWLDLHDATFALVRPDKYVFGTASTSYGLVQLIEAARAKLGVRNLG